MLKELRLSQIANLCHGELVGQDDVVWDVSTDTRDDLDGKLFLSLCGEHFDGHLFAADALAKGAKGVLVNTSSNLSVEPRVVVEDTLIAYHCIANYLRKAFSGHVFSITGSNGKTSVKDWLAQGLSEFGAVLKTQSNLNNQIGVPKTLLQLAEPNQYAVVEAGTSFPGEIEILSKTIQADTVILTNASGSHLEGFGSTQAIAEEKGNLITYSFPNSSVILNYDDPFFSYWKKLAGARKVLSFSLQNKKADIYVSKLELEAKYSNCIVHFRDCECHITIPVPGAHQIYNALAVLLALTTVGIPFSDAVKQITRAAQVPGRMEFGETKNNALLINDCYNASPTSVEAGIDVLSIQKNPSKWLVLGALAELGSQEESTHRALGQYAANAGIQHLLAVGPVAGLAADEFTKAGKDGQVFKDKASLSERLLTLNNEHAILVKGSRSSKMDDVVNAIKN